MSKKWLGAKGLMDEWLPKIGENLGKGWKGGQAIPGIGPTLPGASKLLGEGLKSGVGGAAGLGLGTIGGGALGGFSTYKASGGDLGKTARATLVGAGLGGVAGTTVGLVGPQRVYGGVKWAGGKLEEFNKFGQQVDTAQEIMKLQKAKAQEQSARTAPNKAKANSV